MDSNNKYGLGSEFVFSSPQERSSLSMDLVVTLHIQHIRNGFLHFQKEQLSPHHRVWLVSELQKEKIELKIMKMKI